MQSIRRFKLRIKVSQVFDFNLRESIQAHQSTFTGSYNFSFCDNLGKTSFYEERFCFPELESTRFKDGLYEKLT